jgi:hypothetical protein
MKEEIFLDKVVDKLIRDSKVVKTDEGVYFDPPFLYGQPYTRLHLTEFFITLHPYNSFYITEKKENPIVVFFIRYMNSMYGLTDSEIDYVWREYMNYFKNILSN